MKWIKKYGYLVITAICTLVAISIIFYLQEVSPFGKNSLLTVDFFHQYGPMMGELFDRIKNGSTLLYSFNMGLGLPFFRNFFNYLSSPFNILLFLFSKRDLLTSYSVIIGLKVVVSSITMGILLSKKVDNKYFTIPLSIFYAFSAYFCAYYWNIMWLDGLVMIPLVTLGIENIIDKNKPLTYIISLGVMLFANYFIGYMICIFSVLYFVMYLILNKLEFKNGLKKCLLFSISSLLAGGLCAFFLIPLFDGLKSISATKDAIPFIQYYGFTFKEFIFNHLSGVGSTVFKSDITNAPNISVGVMAFMLIILFIVNPKISIRTKVCYISLLVFLFISFVFAPLDFIWHALHVPNDLPYRYSFIYSFVIILISAISLNKIKDIKKWLVTIIYILVMIFIYLTKELCFLNITREMISLNYLLATICYICIMLCKINKIKIPILIVITLVCIGEVVYTTNNNWNIDQNINSFYSDFDETKKILEQVKAKDDGFYRIERENMLTFNDPSWYDYYGMVAFSSMEYESNALLLYGLGAPSNEINSFYYRYNTPIYNTLFSLNYIIGSPYIKGYEKVIENGFNSVYKNIYSGNLMYAGKDWIKNYVLDYSPFINQNNLIFSITGVDNVLIPLQVFKYEKVTDDDSHVIFKYYIKNNHDNIYMYLNSSDIDFVVFNNKLYYLTDDYEYASDYINSSIWEYNDYNEKYLISDSLEKDTIEVYVGYNNYDEEYSDIGFEIYELDYNNWNSAYDILKDNSVDIKEFRENDIKAYTNYSERKSIFTSIPYDKGWNVYVDNEKVSTYKIADALLGFDVDKGEHEIRLKYSIPYFKGRLIISIVSLIGIISLQIVLKKNQ